MISAVQFSTNRHADLTVLHNTGMLLPMSALFLLLAQTDVDTLLGKREYQRALDQLSVTAARDVRWHLLASQAYDGLGEPAKAVAEAEEALRLEPRNAGAHAQLGQIFLSRNTPSAALEIFTEAVAMLPDTFVLRLGKALALKELQSYHEAEKELLWCLQKQPSSALAFDALATVYLAQSRFSDARQISEEFLRIKPSDYRGYYFLAAAREGELSSAGQTKRLLRECIARNPSFAAAYALMGKVLLREKMTAEALPFLEKAVGLRPDLVQAHLNLARVYRELGNEAAAGNQFELVRELKRKEQEPVPSLLYHRGVPRRSQ